ncbi:unnamed protein product [Protopolystoma xenopodis]|uniref:Uncharacterized protein n=1 Tax=Protopolystoma xenopodis TaxID=117903 RepID=A0A3S5CLI9_9PLAT|nr:unnamed protein product [Protopolystoma xenopodis]
MAFDRDLATESPLTDTTQGASSSGLTCQLKYAELEISSNSASSPPPYHDNTFTTTSHMSPALSAISNAPFFLPSQYEEVQSYPQLQLQFRHPNKAQELPCQQSSIQFHSPVHSYKYSSQNQHQHHHQHQHQHQKQQFQHQQHQQQQQRWFHELVLVRTKSNWKFYLLGLIVADLFVSFLTDTSTVSREAFVRSAFAWLDQKCSLTQLRPRKSTHCTIQPCLHGNIALSTGPLSATHTLNVSKHNFIVAI